MRTNVENEAMTPEEITAVGCGCIIVIVDFLVIVGLISLLLLLGGL